MVAKCKTTCVYQKLLPFFGPFWTHYIFSCWCQAAEKVAKNYCKINYGKWRKYWVLNFYYSLLPPQEKTRSHFRSSCGFFHLEKMTVFYWCSLILSTGYCTVYWVNEKGTYLSYGLKQAGAWMSVISRQMSLIFVECVRTCSHSDWFGWCEGMLPRSSPPPPSTAQIWSQYTSDIHILYNFVQLFQRFWNQHKILHFFYPN